MKAQWKSFNIMEAIRKTDVSWGEVTEKYERLLEKKLQPEVIKSDENGQAVSNILNDIA